MQDIKLEKAVADLWRLRWRTRPDLPDLPVVTIVSQWAPDCCPQCEQQLVISARYQFSDGVETTILFASCVGTARAHPFILWPVAD